MEENSTKLLDSYERKQDQMPPWKQNTWTDQLYHYAEYLYWEPQHINRKAVEKGSMKTFKEMREKIRKKEVPLNILFNMMIQLLPFRLKQQILSCFVEPARADFGERIDYITIYEKISDLDFIQPDVVLETEKAYVCIEFKVDASLSLSQIYKYIFLLALWQSKSEIRKTPYLFLLTKEDLQPQWKSEERNIIFPQTKGDLTTLHHFLKTTDLPPTFKSKNPFANLHNEAADIIDRLRLGEARWYKINQSLQEELNHLNKMPTSDGKEILEKLIGDFLGELQYRGLDQLIKR